MTLAQLEHILKTGDSSKEVVIKPRDIPDLIESIESLYDRLKDLRYERMG